MNNMEYKDLLETILIESKKKMEDAEIFMVRNKDISINVYKGEISKYSIAESGGLSLRGLTNGKMGYSYTEKLDETSIDMLVNGAIENSKYIDGDPETIFAGSDNYHDKDHFNEGLREIGTDEKIQFLMDLENTALELDERVFSVNGCAYQEIENQRNILNSKGVDLQDRFNGAFVYISVVVKEGEDTKTGSSYRAFNDFSTLDYKEIAKEAVDNAISMLGAKSIASNNYPIIFENRTFASLISAFSPIFNAENVQKGLSLLKGKIGEEIATPLLTIVDDPFLENGFGSRNFDDEGTKSSFKKLIDNGQLKTYLYNWKAANKDEVQSTGNASRSYKGPISISPTNLYIEKGNMDLKELKSLVGEGLYIDDLQGLHSGLNPVSGDFSLSASGYRIENGKVSKPVNQITIAGNLFEVFKNIEAIANDLEFIMPLGGYIGSPSVFVKTLTVSGE